MKQYLTLTLLISFSASCMQENTPLRIPFINPTLEQAVQDVDADKVAHIEQLSQSEKRMLALELCTAYQAAKTTEDSMKKAEESATDTVAQQLKEYEIKLSNGKTTRVSNRTHLESNGVRCAQQ